MNSKNTTAIKKFEMIFVSPSPKKDLRLSPKKTRNLRIKEPRVTESTTPIARSKFTIYGQIFETKAVRSNSMSHLCYSYVLVKMKLRSSTIYFRLAFYALQQLGEKLTQLKSGVRGKLDSQKWVHGTKKFGKPCSKKCSPYALL